MMRSGPIMIIEDDRDDQELLEETFSTLNYPNEVIFFANGNEALEYLDKTSTPPALIISDINMPVINGFEIKEKINKDSELRNRCIPFIFFTTSAQKCAVVDAYSLSDQGFFSKPNSMENLRNTIKTIVDYWLRSYTPALYNNDSQRQFYTKTA
jgi:CheY-like chemotaxis protein